MKLFRGFLNVRSNVAQIILIVIFLPTIAVIIRLISGSGGAGNMSGMLNSLIGEIPLCGVWVDVLYQINGGLSASDVASSASLVILKAFPETLISAICVFVCERISKKIRAWGLPIFATFLGIVIATIITSLTGLSGNVTTEILIDFGVILVMLVGLKFMFNSVLGSTGVFVVKKVLMFIIDGLLAVITTGYIAGLLLAATGAYASTGEAMGRVIILTGAELVAVALAWIVGSSAEDE